MQNPRITEYGNKYWYNKNGQFHRTDGPAVVYATGQTYWYTPAGIYPDGRTLFYINNQELTNTQYYFYNYLCKVKE